VKLYLKQIEMLNISPHRIRPLLKDSDFSVLNYVEAKQTKKLLRRILLWSFVILLIILLLPWTQNVRSNGMVSTLEPDQRPQTVHSVIAGRIQSWHVREGDEVKKGDTLAIITEIKDAYFDSQLLPRTKSQIDLKEQSVDSYSKKEDAQREQLMAMKQNLDLSLAQNKIKMNQRLLDVQNDSLAYLATQLDYATAMYQYKRMDSLYTLGLKSLVDLEQRRIKMQGTKARETAGLNNWLNGQNEYLRLKFEQESIQRDYENQSAKIRSELLTTNTNRFDASSNINKLENEYANYERRSSFYAITAPQDGYVTKTFINGIGETVKEGEAILSVMPSDYDLAVEIFVNPIDLPLMHVGEKLQIQFDGWPAIVFSGWPNASYGTYAGEIYAIDKFISENGKFRILVKPDKKNHVWPKALRYGGGVRAMILLDDVQIWYELWRQVNGFPPNFYVPGEKVGPKKKSK
jgi:adhesin transport system membrane fusion protein